MPNLATTLEEVEHKRLKTLHQYKILDSASSSQFDELAILATFIFSAPYAFISFIDDKKQWLKSSISLPFNEIPLYDSICVDLINENHTSVIAIENILDNPKFKNHPWANKSPNIKLFISVPLIAPNGCVIGSMAVLDTKEKIISPEQIVNLQTLASQVVSQLELMRTNEELRKMMIQVSKLSDLGIYAATIAHEINTPLTILTGQNELLDQKNANRQVTPEVLKKFTQSNERNIQRITKIVAGLKNLTRDGKDDPFESTYVTSIFDDIKELCLKKISEKDVELSFECSPNATLECRHSQISQVLVNLISNASDAIEKLPSKWIKVGCMDTGSEIVLTVTDSGNGIPNEVSDKMFSQFFTTKEAGKGTGIGLTVSAEIMKDHNGEMSIDKKCPNTKFVLKFPKHNKN
jgi:signal transduction histidine kinase